MSKKIALCFIISYPQIINHESLWRKWMAQSSHNLFNVYIHCKDKTLIQSEWVKTHCLPDAFIVPTSYYHVVPAYMNLLLYARHHDPENKWFCFLSESCVPMVSPLDFQTKFEAFSEYSFLKWSRAWWSVAFHRRANLHRLPSEYHLGHDPWFILSQSHVDSCLSFMKKERNLYRLMCKGIIANESIFIIMLLMEKNMVNVINSSSTYCDWTRRSSATSPYVFKKRNEKSDILFLKEMKQKKELEYCLFLRKVEKGFDSKLLFELCS